MYTSSDWGASITDYQGCPECALALACNAIFGFSYKPLRLSHFLGTAAVLFSMLLVVAALLRPAGGGWAVAPVASAFFIGGVQLICVGILGEYIGRIYDEVRRRPLFLIQEIYPGGGDGDDSSGSAASRAVRDAPEPLPANGEPHTTIHAFHQSAK